MVKNHAAKKAAKRHSAETGKPYVESRRLTADHSTDSGNVSLSKQFERVSGVSTRRVRIAKASALRQSVNDSRWVLGVDADSNVIDIDVTRGKNVMVGVVGGLDSGKTNTLRRLLVHQLATDEDFGISAVYWIVGERSEFFLSGHDQEPFMSNFVDASSGGAMLYDSVIQVVEDAVAEGERRMGLDDPSSEQQLWVILDQPWGLSRIPEEVERGLSRLAQMPPVGISVIVATHVDEPLPKEFVDAAHMIHRDGCPEVPSTTPRFECLSLTAPGEPAAAVRSADQEFSEHRSDSRETDRKEKQEMWMRHLWHLSASPDFGDPPAKEQALAGIDVHGKPVWVGVSGDESLTIFSSPPGGGSYLPWEVAESWRGSGKGREVWEVGAGARFPGLKDFDDESVSDFIDRARNHQGELLLLVDGEDLGVTGDSDDIGRLVSDIAMRGMDAGARTILILRDSEVRLFSVSESISHVRYSLDWRSGRVLSVSNGVQEETLFASTSRRRDYR